ncbi:MAG: hypothetical protein WCT53_02990 [Candidatus Gracilibacteria bacterium]
MKKIPKYVYVVAVVVAIGVGALLFSQNVKATLPVSEDNIEKVQSKTYSLSPFKMVPFVSQKQSRKNICDLKIDGPIATVCDKKYNTVRAKDTAKIDELFVILSDVNDSNAPTEMAKYLTTQLIFSTLPRGAAKKTSAEISKMLQVNSLESQLVAQADSISPLRSGLTRAEYINQMQNDFNAVKSNCPQPGDENWVFLAMCSEHKWTGDVQQPIYSRQYAEYGGSCIGDAGQIERTKIESIVNTKMRSDYDFVNEKGTSSQIACAFTCASYKCPKLEQAEAERTQCKNPIYHPFYSKNEVKDLTLKDKTIAFDTANTECKDRAYDYVKRADGTSTLKKVRNCKLSFNSDTSYNDPQFGRSVPVRTYCCSCDRQQRDPYVSVYDFSQPGYTGDDWFKKIIDVAKQKIEDDLPKTPIEDTATKQPVKDELPPKTPVKDVIPKQPVEDIIPQQPLVTPPTTPKKEEKQEVKVDRLRFTCAVTKKRDQDGVLELHLDGKMEWVDASGKPAYVSYYGIPNGGGVASIGRACISITDEVPQCVDPRTNKPTDSPLDFTMEYVPTAQRTAAAIGEESNKWFWTMGDSLRKCQASELPPESYFR